MQMLLAIGSVILVGMATGHGGIIQSSPEAARLSRDWRRVTTPSLSIVGNAGQDDLRRVGLEMERFRQAIHVVFPGARLDSPVPTTVFVFRDDAAFRPFKPRMRGKVDDNVGGFFTALPHVNYIALAPTGNRAFTFQLIFHEYTHYLINRNFKRLPPWLNEGLAELYGTFGGDERDGRTIVGRPIGSHVATLLQRHPMPLATFVRPETTGQLFRDPQGRAFFYAQAWALTHCLLIGNNGVHRAQLGRYVAAIERGAPFDRAFTEVFGPDLSTLDRELVTYVSRFSMVGLQLQLDKLSLELRAERMREIEAESLQGDLLAHMGASELAERHLSIALDLEPTYVPARLSRAALRLRAERFADALDIVSAPDLEETPGAAVHYVRAEALRALERYVDAAAAYRRVVALQPDAPHAYYGLSLTQVATGDPGGAASFARCKTLSPDPSWHVRRQRDMMRMGMNQFVVSDARTYLDTAGWNGEQGAYVMLPAVITLLRIGAKDAAFDALTEIEKHVSPESWPAALVAFFRGKLSADALVAKAKRDDGLLTEAHAYAGILASIAGDRNAALTHLDWVDANGQKDYIEYGFALGERRRLQRTPAS